MNPGGRFRRRETAEVGAEFVIELPSDLRLIEATVCFLVGRCRAFAFDGSRLDLNFRVGVTEALANAVLYGNASDPDRTVRIEVTLDPARVEVCVADEGDGFDPDTVPDPTTPENIQSPGGRGLFLMRELMDEIHFNERGNAVRMVLGRDAPAGPLGTQVMPHSTPTLTPVAAPAKARELLEEYGRTHGLRVWFWQRIGDDWSLAAGTGSPPHPVPGETAVPITGLAGPDACVEVEGTDAERARSSARFLALALAQVLQHDAESRFFGRELAERYEEITLLYTISEVLGSVISLETAAHTILREVADTMAVVRAALWIYEPGLAALRLVAAVGENVPPGPIPLDDETSITATVFRERRPMILEPGDIYPGRHPTFTPSNPDSFLSVPVTYTPPRGESRTIGVINLMGRRVEEGFSAGDHKLITAIASQIGAAVENSRLVANSLRQERIVREMELAHDLQLKLLPSVEEFRGDVEVAARCSPADSVGGDLYHLFRLPGDRLGVMIGDISSHGFGAALIMALTMSAVAIHASDGDPPAEVLRRVHRTLIDELESTEMYMTVVYGVIDPAQRSLTYTNAGHPYAFTISRSGEARRLTATSPPVGIAGPDAFSQETVPWEPGGDLLFLFTDGLSDALGVRHGDKYLVDQLVQARDRPLDSLIQLLFDLEPQREVPSDDRTAVLLRI